MIEASALAFDMDYGKLEALVRKIIETISDEERDEFRKAIRPR
jgi:hypothetical protein